MNDSIRDAIKPKSDQLNADDLTLAPLTIKISRVVVSDAREQPVSVFFDGDNGKPWKPCKSMLRVLGKVYGESASKWVGHSVTLYRDDKVKWAGSAVGGIRISAMTGLEHEISLPLTVTKGSRAMFVVAPLSSTSAPVRPTKKAATPEEKAAKAKAIVDAITADILAASDVDVILAKHADMLARIRTGDAAAADALEVVAKQRRIELAIPIGQRDLIADDGDKR